MQHPEGQKQISVLYIMGCGRSGSTILDIVLGGHSDVTSLGELYNAPRRAWRGGEYCSCGVPAPECNYWTAVRKEWAARNGDDDIERYAVLQRKFERYRSWFTLASKARRGDAQFSDYARRTRNLYESIQAVSGSKWLVDSSKSPARARALLSIEGIDVHGIFLVRDGRGVVWSRLKAFTKDEKAGLPKALGPWPIWQTSLGWSLANALSLLTLRRILRLWVRYEDFITDPDNCLGRIEKFTGLDLSEARERIASGGEFAVGHLVSGNRVRMSGGIRLRPDTEWRERLPLHARLVFWFFAWPVWIWLWIRRKEFVA